MYNEVKVFIIMYIVAGSISVGSVYDDIEQAITALYFEGYEPMENTVSPPASFRLKSGELGWAAIHERTLITKT